MMGIGNAFLTGDETLDIFTTVDLIEGVSQETTAAPCNYTNFLDSSAGYISNLMHRRTSFAHGRVDDGKSPYHHQDVAQPAKRSW